MVAETVTMAVARQAPRNGFSWMWSSILPIERSNIPVGIRRPSRLMSAAMAARGRSSPLSRARHGTGRVSPG